MLNKKRRWTTITRYNIKNQSFSNTNPNQNRECVQFSWKDKLLCLHCDWLVMKYTIIWHSCIRKWNFSYKKWKKWLSHVKQIFHQTWLQLFHFEPLHIWLLLGSNPQEKMTWQISPRLSYQQENTYSIYMQELLKKCFHMEIEMSKLT